MRLHCDVCEKAEAMVMCCADEAVLCTECDIKVHEANKLASKHQRIALIRTKKGDHPCCDICQEKTGYFFCLEDRALLCRSCDVSIHSANALASNHRRFLVSGIRVALEVLSSKEREGSVCSKADGLNVVPTVNLDPESPLLSSDLETLTENQVNSTYNEGQNVYESEISSVPSERIPICFESQNGPLREIKNSISDFLGETVPGWGVDDLWGFTDYSEMNNVCDLKTEIPNCGEFEWADFSFLEGALPDAFHTVPSSQTGASSRPKRAIIDTPKAKTRQDDLFYVPQFEDAFTVPDVGLRFVPASSPALKRQRF